MNEQKYRMEHPGCRSMPARSMQCHPCPSHCITETLAKQSHRFNAYSFALQRQRLPERLSRPDPFSRAQDSEAVSEAHTRRASFTNSALHIATQPCLSTVLTSVRSWSLALAVPAAHGLSAQHPPPQLTPAAHAGDFDSTCHDITDIDKQSGQSVQMVATYAQSNLLFMRKQEHEVCLFANETSHASMCFLHTGLHLAQVPCRL